MRTLIYLLLFVLSRTTLAQDSDWVRAWEKTQRQRPSVIGAVGRIAPAGEPGTPLVIHGRIFESDGSTPAPGVTIFAYQTDTGGVYNRRGMPGWRLHGWAKSDREGRFEFRTIRPGSYPKGGTPAHVHMTIERPGLSRRWVSELQFLDDPLLPAHEKKASAAKGKFGAIRPVAVRGGVQHVELNLRVSSAGRF